MYITYTHILHLNAVAHRVKKTRKKKLNVNFNKRRFMKGIDRCLHVYTYSKSQTHASNNIDKFLKERENDSMKTISYFSD